MEAIVPWVLEALQWENRPPRSALVAIHNWRGARVPEGDVGTVVVGPLLHLMGTRNPFAPSCHHQIRFDCKKSSNSAGTTHRQG